jgi:hypothetical protein
LQPALGAPVYGGAAFTVLPVYHDTDTFVKKSEHGDFHQFLFPDKYKGSFADTEHQHNIEHARMVCDKHITLSGLKALFPLYTGRASHTVQYKICPDISRQPEKLRVGMFANSKQKQEGKENENGNSHKDIKPDVIQHSCQY